MPVRLCAVSVDLDDIPHYHAIHGLAAPAAGSASSAVYDIALERLAAFAASRSMPLTLFAIGADLERPASAAALRDLTERGHAVENHSLSHRYDLVRLGAESVASEIDGGSRAIAAATGRVPVGFRAPGYTVTDEVFDVLEARGIAFDSSVFPCPVYFGAKALVLAALWARARKSASVLDSARVLTAPTRPYRPGRPWYRRGHRGFVELPIQVTPGLRLPFIGTTLSLAGPLGARLLASACAGEPFVNLELHGIDFLDAKDGLSDLSRHQPELRIPLARRIDALGAALDVLALAGYSFVLLEEVALAFR
jgi:hypothetical protein